MIRVDSAMNQRIVSRPRLGWVAVPRRMAWARYVVPSMSDLFFIVLFGVFVFGAHQNRLLYDADIGWHIRNGQQILETRAVPYMDSFSSTMAGKPWYAWEWLYDVIVGAVEWHLGLNGIVVLGALLIATTFVTVLRLAVRMSGSLPLGLVLVVLAVWGSLIHALARPHVVSWLFTVVWWAALEGVDSEPLALASSSRRREFWTANRHLLWLPLLTVVWVNLHPGFLLGLILIGLYAVGNVCRFSLGADPCEQRGALRKAAAFTATGVLCAATALVNPYGYRLYTHVYGYLTNRFLMDHIQEFASPSFHVPEAKCFVLLIMLSVTAVAMTRTHVKPAHLLVMLFSIASGLYAIRNAPAASILLVLVTASLLGNRFLARASDAGRHPAGPLLTMFSGFSRRVTAQDSQLRGHAWPLVAVLATVWVCMHGGWVAGRQVLAAEFDEVRFPVRAAKVLGREGIRDGVFTPDWWGGYLIYRLGPEFKVTVDDRHDLYGHAYLEAYLKTIAVDDGWKDLLTRSQTTRILVPSKSVLANTLKESRWWSVRHEDPTAILFERTKP